jgi:LacI family transcriptional regulator
MNISELARHANLSKGAVSLALRDHPSISTATRKRVKALARKFSYVPDPTMARVMSAIARRRTSTITAPLAILSLWDQPRAWNTTTPSLKRFYQGLVNRAQQLGFRTEEFWMGNRQISPQRMEQILSTRGIEGLIVLNYPHAPATLEMNLAPFACAVIGRALLRPRLFATDHDHHQGLFQVIEKLRSLGYRRPGFLLDREVNERTMHCWAAAYQFWLNSIPRSHQIPLLTLDLFDGSILRPNDIKPIQKWVRRYRPDAIISHSSEVKRLIEAAGIRVPQDVGFANLFWQAGLDRCAGLDLQDEIVAGRAVELVIEQLQHNQRGIPAVPETVLFPGVWRDGPTLPDRVPATGKATRR